ncbi:two-component system, chemotaxis family, sensor kinase CheA [Sulfurivirga caldicuralii]|uniref:Chemotaxis protein CheA n=1 Tax=Sulfurivirga caldicuralii TaxID=364032 RepID=A0A1N6FKD8_9GAMM|nr:chemotaxis protein CheA [Sulfurivirga caldicuralii]SIN95732.1 two-component system, chemotaxis family, sensor kinase CheA [Sulfurivirga caldicuralii]
MDEDILQDFLAEAQDLLEQLNEQLVDLEQVPDDIELLNAIFRAFHTIKGGAGFIGIKPLVEVCHRAENVFDKIRNSEMTYTPEVADIILQVYDTITDMINRLQEGEREFEDVDPDLLARLDALVKGGSATPSESTESSSASDTTMSETAAVAEVPLELPEDWDPDDDITDEEFELLLQMREQKLAAGEVGADDDNKALAEVPLELPEGWDPDEDITDEEFEQLLQMREEKLSQVESAAESDGADHVEPEPAPAETGTSSQPAAVAEHSQIRQVNEEPAMPADKTKAAEPKAESTAPAAKSESTVRVDTKRLDEIMNLVGELVLVRNRLLTLRNGQEVDLEEISNAVSNLDHVTTDLQAAVMKTRMQPVKKVFGRFPRVVRDLARKLGKQIELELRGEDTDLDKNLVEALADPLVHLVRNSVDHGIEPPEERIKAGKPPVGHIILAAEQEGDHILLSITDDGRGMDPEKLKRKAIEKGLIDEMTAAQMSDKEAFELIMAPGFSTAETISDISGRGVGMDVVKSMITRLNGSIEIDSVQGQGTQIKIRVPLTLAILPTLMVAFGEDSYSIPLTSVQEIFDYNPDETNRIDGQMMVQLRERSIPLYFLQEWLAPDIEPQPEGNEAERDKVVIVNVGGQRVGLVVQQVKGQEEVVIKPLGVMLQKVAGYAGATITGNGSIALILDLPGVLQRYNQMH